MKLKGKVTAILICIMLGMTIFFGLVQIEKGMLKAYEKVYVIRAQCDCEAGTELTALNVKGYFALEEINKELLTESSITDLKALENCYLKQSVKKGELLYKSALTSSSVLFNGYGTSVELSLTVSKEESRVAGDIRQGDLVNVYATAKAVNERTVEKVLTEVCIYAAYDKNGKKIQLSDENTAAVAFSIFIDEASAEEILGKINNKNIVILRVNKGADMSKSNTDLRTDS